MKITKRELEITEKLFSVVEDDNYYEFENWTNGGVNMVFYLDKDSDMNFIDSLYRFATGFENEIDETIDAYRESENYRNNFTIRESVKDFEDWVNEVYDLVDKLEEESK